MIETQRAIITIFACIYIYTRGAINRELQSHACLGYAIPRRSSELHVITSRQAFSCVNDSSCSPSNVNSTGVKCINGACVCSGSCFTLDGATAKCKFSTCGLYTNNVCIPIGQKSQLTAFLLSFFVMPTGAANFYIGQNGLGMYVLMHCMKMHASVTKCMMRVNTAAYTVELAPFTGGAQLAVFLLSIILSCVSCCVKICLSGGDGEGSSKLY